MAVGMGGAALTPDNKGAGVNLAVFITLAIVVIAVISKIGTKLVKIRIMQLDDWILVASMLLVVACGVTVSRQVTAGLGRHLNTLTSSEVDTYQKTGYSSEFLYILIMAGSKAATLCFIYNLSTVKSYHRAAFLTMTVLGSWTAAALLGIAFQCTKATSGYWAIISPKCSNQLVFWSFMEGVGIIIDFALVGILIYIIWAIKMPTGPKIALISAFSTRLIEVPIAILRVVYIGQAHRTTDRTWSDVPSVITTQVLLSVSIIVACLPFLKTFMQHLQRIGWSRGAARTWYGIDAPLPMNTTAENSRVAGPGRDALALRDSAFSGHKSNITAYSEAVGSAVPSSHDFSRREMVITQQRDIVITQE